MAAGLALFECAYYNTNDLKLSNCINKKSSAIDAVFVSEMGSESFDKFLSLLGDSVTLQGWAGYRGGLDTKSERAQLWWLTFTSAWL